MRPYDDRFQGDNFWHQPEWLIFEALEYSMKIEQEKLHRYEKPIAALTALFYNCNRGKDSKALSEKDFYKYAPPSEEEKQITSDMAASFFALAREEKLPTWTTSIAPIELLRAKFSKGDKVRELKAFIGEKIVIINPKISGELITGELALIQGKGEDIVTNPDNCQKVKLIIPDVGIRAYWQTGIEYELMNN